LAHIKRQKTPQTRPFLAKSQRTRHPPAAWIEAAKGLQRLKACKQLPILKAALRAIQNRHALERTGKAG